MMMVKKYEADQLSKPSLQTLEHITDTTDLNMLILRE